MSYKKYWRIGLIVLIIGLLAFGGAIVGLAGYPEECEGPKVQPVLGADVPQYFTGPSGTAGDPDPGTLPSPEDCDLESFKINLDQNQIVDGKTYKINDGDVSSSDPDSEFEVTIYKSDGNVYFAFSVESNHSVMHVYAKGGSVNERGNFYRYYFPEEDPLYPNGVTEDCGLSQPGGGWSHITFFYCELEPATKSGYKFNDLNADGVWDDGEPALEGWTINLWTEVEGVLTIVDSTTTDEDGKYEFTTLTPGVDYFVSEVIQEGWTQSFPNQDNVDAGEALFIDGVGFVWGPINLESGEVEEDNNFGNYQPKLKCDTAWAAHDVGEYRYVPRGNWATYVEYQAGMKVPLIAAQTYHIGWVTFTELNGQVEIEIQLINGWKFDEDYTDNIMIQDYSSKPRGNPAPGRFAHKKHATGIVATMTVPLNVYYGVHVQACGSQLVEYEGGFMPQANAMTTQAFGTMDSNNQLDAQSTTVENEANTSYAPEAPGGGMPAAHGVDGRTFGELVSEKAQEDPLGLADHVQGLRPQ